MPGGGAGEFDFAFIDALAGRDVEGVLVEVAVVDAAVLVAGFGEDELDAAGLVEDLETGFGADEEVTTGGGKLTVEGAAAIGGGALGVEVGLFVDGVSGLEGVGVNEGAVEMADEELGLVGAEADAIGAIEGEFAGAGSAGIHPDDLLVFGTGEVDIMIVADDDIIWRRRFRR